MLKNQDFLVLTLKSSLRKLYGRRDDLAHLYGMSVLTTDDVHENVPFVVVKHVISSFMTFCRIFNMNIYCCRTRYSNQIMFAYWWNKNGWPFLSMPCLVGFVFAIAIFKHAFKYIKYSKRFTIV
jgi:hypothetical protein